MNNTGTNTNIRRYGPRAIFSEASLAKIRECFNARMLIRLILTLVLAFVIYLAHIFSVFAEMQQQIYAQGSRLEVEYQRRANLIPNLTEVTRNYSQYEQELLRYIADVRVLQMSYEKFKGGLEPAKKAQIEKVVLRLVAMAEQYPDLKAERSYQALMAKNVTTENRIARARERYAVLIGEYNATVQAFPYNMFARVFHFEKLDQYVPERDPMPERDERFFFIY